MGLSRQSKVSAFQYALWVDHSFSSKEQVSFNFMAAFYKVIWVIFLIIYSNTWGNNFL